MRTIRNLTGLLFGLAIGIIAFLAMIPVHADPVAIPKQQIPMVIAFQDGRARAATTLDVADNLEACMAALKSFIADWTPKSGVVLQTGCIEIPQIPVAAQKGDNNT
jgi:hypothetical protein